MKIASEIKTRQDFDELKSLMEILIVKNRIRELAKNA
jgi:hypothetical protein